jgi:hypothetical protein
LVDALIHASNAELKAAQEAYLKMFNKNMVEDVVGDTSGDFKHLLVGILAVSLLPSLFITPQTRFSPLPSLPKVLLV